MLLSRLIDSAVNVPVVLQRLWPTVQTVQNIQKFRALFQAQGCVYMSTNHRDSRCRVHSKRWLGRVVNSGSVNCTQPDSARRHRLASRRDSSRVEWNLISSTLPGHWWCSKQLFRDLGESCWFSSRSVSVHLTLKPETPLVLLIRSFTADFVARQIARGLCGDHPAQPLDELSAWRFFRKPFAQTFVDNAAWGISTSQLM